MWLYTRRSLCIMQYTGKVHSDQRIPKIKQSPSKNLCCQSGLKFNLLETLLAIGITIAPLHSVPGDRYFPSFISNLLHTALQVQETI